MINLKKILEDNASLLVGQIKSAATGSGFSLHTANDGRAWLSSIEMLNSSLSVVLDEEGVDWCGISPDGICSNRTVRQFTEVTARRHRQQDVGLPQFMGMLKLYRKVYLSVLDAVTDDGAALSKYRTFISYFFDQVEIAQCSIVEESLNEQKHKATHYLDIVNTMVVALDSSGSVVFINRKGSEILGYSNRELVGRDWTEAVIPVEDRPEVKEFIFNVLGGWSDMQEEHVNHVITSEGQNRLVSWRNRLLTNEQGEPVGVLSSGTDITDQREWEEAMAERELWLRSTFVALGEAVLVVGWDDRIVDANPAAESMFGRTNEELCASTLVDLHIDREHSAKFAAHYDGSLGRRGPIRFEFSMRRSNGDIFPTEHSVSRIMTDAGTSLGTVHAIRDISNRKRAERVLRESEEKFRRIFETIKEGFLVTDLNGTIEMVNPATCELLGYSERELLGRNMGALYVDNAERAELRQLLESKGIIQGMQLTALRKDGREIVVDVNAHLVDDENGNHLAIEGTFRDITERIEAEKILREQERHYRAFFENNHAVMLLEDPKTGAIVDANPAAEEFYGHPLQAMRGMPVERIRAVDEKELYGEMSLARQEDRSYFILKHRLASDELRDVEVYSGPILVEGRQLIYSVIHDVTERIRLEAEMKRMATKDALTGADNRHQFFHKAGMELRRVQRYSHSLSVLMLDIDYFKSINDSFGHQTGDDVLRALTVEARATLRESDTFGRLGGEEFAAILPETNTQEALRVAERLRRNLAALSLHLKGQDLSFTVSIGVAEYSENDTKIEEVLNRADEALYKAKRGGRNRVEHG